MSERPSPDLAEEELGPLMDDIVPTHGYGMVPVVGLGGSAGSIEVLQRFFSQLPPDSGVAFVVVIHLSADHESTLAELLQRCTAMPVIQVREGLEVKPGTVYVIPPGKMLRARSGRLGLSAMPEKRAPHVAVDIFFRTLADSHGPHAAAVVLSGMDGDGAIGVKRIKERGGLTVAQDPAEASYPAMPRSSIATGMVDWVLPVEAMPARILAYFRLEQRLNLPDEDKPPPPGDRQHDDERTLQDVLGFLKARTARDFSNYKRATVLRRLGRRMQINGVDNLGSYLNCLRTRQGETTALLQDLLISVTNFFRDSDAFAALEQRIPELFEGKEAGDTVRAWVVACATGEEAYSVAMLLAEHARTLSAPPTIQVFASDIDEESLRAARQGVYPRTIDADVSEQRLQRFFVKHEDGYRVRRELRELILFSLHDVLRDPSFSRMNLITCRNLLIYLSQPAQQRVLDALHFSLVPHGKLFLGTSDSAEDGGELFTPLDKKYRLYAQRPRGGARAPRPPAPSALAHSDTGRGALPYVAGAGFDRPVDDGPAPPRNVAARHWGETHLRVLEQLAPPSVLVDGEYELVHLSPTAGRFLRAAGGEPTRNLLRMLHPDLAGPVRAALFQAGQTHETCVVNAVRLHVDGGEVDVGALVTHSVDQGEHVFLVRFITGDSPGVAQASASDASIAISRHLDREVERLKSQLRETVEQYEAAAEEAKASNEELRAMNEELRSATEEMETSREEMQSVNEELGTVNSELQLRIGELSSANSDLHNLMAATEIAIVFVDVGLRITRYTPAATAVFSLIPTDVGRPLTDLTTRLNYPALDADAKQVLERLVPLEREVGQTAGRWYLARLLPYRTLDNHIAGVVFAFIDISERKRAEEMHLWLASVVGSASDAIFSFNLDQKILSWNTGAERMFGYGAAEIVGRRMDVLGQADASEQDMLIGKIQQGSTVENYVATRLRQDGSPIRVALTISPIRDEDGRVIASTAIARDITAAQAFAEELRDTDEQYRLMVESSRDFAIFTTDLERRIRRWNVGAERLLGFTRDEAQGLSADVLFTPEDQDAGRPQQEAQKALATGRASGERHHVRGDGSRFWGTGSLVLIRDSAQRPAGFAWILRDETAALALRQRLDDALQALGRSSRDT